MATLPWVLSKHTLLQVNIYIYFLKFTRMLILKWFDTIGANNTNEKNNLMSKLDTELFHNIITFFNREKKVYIFTTLNLHVLAWRTSFDDDWSKLFICFLGVYHRYKVYLARWAITLAPQAGRSMKVMNTWSMEITKNSARIGSPMNLIPHQVLQSFCTDSVTHLRHTSHFVAQNKILSKIEKKAVFQVNE